MFRLYSVIKPAFAWWFFKCWLWDNNIPSLGPIALHQFHVSLMLHARHHRRCVLQVPHALMYLSMSTAEGVAWKHIMDSRGNVQSATWYCSRSSAALHGCQKKYRMIRSKVGHPCKLALHQVGFSEISNSDGHIAVFRLACSSPLLTLFLYLFLSFFLSWVSKTRPITRLADGAHLINHLGPKRLHQTGGEGAVAFLEETLYLSTI